MKAVCSRVEGSEPVCLCQLLRLEVRNTSAQTHTHIHTHMHAITHYTHSYIRQGCLSFEMCWDTSNIQLALRLRPILYFLFFYSISLEINEPLSKRSASRTYAISAASLQVCGASWTFSFGTCHSRHGSCIHAWPGLVSAQDNSHARTWMCECTRLDLYAGMNYMRVTPSHSYGDISTSIACCMRSCPEWIYFAINSIVVESTQHLICMHMLWTLKNICTRSQIINIQASKWHTLHKPNVLTQHGAQCHSFVRSPALSFHHLKKRVCHVSNN